MTHDVFVAWVVRVAKDISRSGEAPKPIGPRLPGDVTYDAAGRMTEDVDPDGTITTYTYDARGLLVEVTVTEPGGTEPEIPYPEPDPNQPTSGTISPIFECWTQEADGTYTAYWGYENRTAQNGQPVGRTIAHGTQNRLRVC